MDKIDTQGMSLPIEDSKGIEIEDNKIEKEYKFRRLRMFEDTEREEIKRMIHEVLDEREKRIERVDESWLYRGTY